jgi:hypothetical protein
MSENYENPGFAEDESDERTPSKDLEPAKCHFPLPHGGYVEARYWLRKGSRPLLGCHPGKKFVESYFSTQDDATLELVLENHSKYHIRHARVSDVRLMSYVGGPHGLQHAEKELQQPNEGKLLPDGNALIEIVPSDAYYGHLHPNQPVSKDFSIITRGTAPGKYYVCMRLDYSVDNCDAQVHLPLKVRRD